ncbi:MULTISPECIES: extracellular solute-binding protein [unclassified Paenibacillus]|uniref:extracellular solute-binding protein n=1 Tax=unclassified Paenibacillus TaxID=185978 RepID=UPI0027831DD9|nr:MULTISPECIES: extracellular solute-binding protein [unclassified Paenibacillus]MDQ0902163.1 putative aldouronate transport system substrate-binding protein [Paenibacillus sp. V4I7]MDQ0919343.1 putative aldouronate transport system substrate-binding protein [Paenibacillus sp. V4I5]
MKSKSWLSLTIVAVMTGSLLSACSEEQGTVESSTSPTANTKDVANLNKKGMPIVKEPISLTFFTGKAPTNGNNFEETLVWKEYAKMTNVNVKFQLVPFENLNEKRNLVLAGGDYPDAFYSSRVSSADLAKYGAQGTFVKLNDLIDNYAPNFKKLMEKYPDLKKGLTMPDGGIYSFPSFYSPDFLPMLIGTPLWVKQEWLEKLKMKEPTTTEEFYQYLKAVKNTDLNGNGQADEVPYAGEGINPLIEQIRGAWDFGNRGLGHKFVDVDSKSNELRFFRTDPKYKEVIEYVRKLYTEGLIDKEIFTVKPAALYAKGQKGVFGSTINPNPMTQMSQPGYYGLGALKGPHGDQLFTQIKVPIVWPGSFVVTDKNKNPEATIRWIDHLYGDEGATFYFMGVEGQTYKKAADGKLEFVEEITKNPNGLTMDQALAKYITWLGGSYPGYVQEKYFKGSETLPESIAVGKKAEQHKVKELWNAFNFTQEETEFRSTVGNDIQNYISEMEAKFISGSAPMSEWDKYVSTVDKMGVGEYMKIYKQAYDRYKK